jgi:hypothetical protein
MAASNALSWDLNRRAYIDKWGSVPPDLPLYTKPWNELPLWATRPDLAGRVKRAWKK